MSAVRQYAAWLLVLLSLDLTMSTVARGAGLPPWLPRYDVQMDLDPAAASAKVWMRATWTNHSKRATRELVFNAHSRYTVPDKDVGLMAKTLEILRMNPGEVLGDDKPAFDLHTMTLAATADSLPAVLSFHFEGDTGTTLVAALPRAVNPGESVTVELDFTFHLPKKQGRWGVWCDVTSLSNWLPVFAVFDDCKPEGKEWQPTPFVPWHQPFYNESCIYHVTATLPCGQQVATTGTVTATKDLGDGRQQLEIQAVGVRDFAFLCSPRYCVFEGEVSAGPCQPRPVRVRVLAFKEHEYYATAMVKLACEAIATYSRWFGAYPWSDFTIAESFFGWNGNECATLVMIDERVFGMPHLAGAYVDYLIYHETCHQWWYNAVGTNGYCETWMDEALATHFAHRMLTERVGKDDSLMSYPKALDWLPNIRRADYRTYGFYGTLGRGENGPVLRDMPDFKHLVNLFSMCYDKGSRIVGMIEDRLGPTAFLDFMRVVYARYQFRIIRVADFRRELEEYTGYSWQEFFDAWLTGPGITDWAVDRVDVQPPPFACQRWGLLPRRRQASTANALEEQGNLTRVVVTISQRGPCTEQTSVGFALPDCEGYPVRVPILPQASELYQIDNPPAVVEPLSDNKYRVEVLLPTEPTQVAIDPDQVLVDSDPSNNYWKPPIRFRVTPVYTFLDETDLTCSYDRWNVIVGPWIYGTAYDDPWYTRSTMLGVRAGAYRTQEFDGGVYAAYRTDYRDIVVGADALWSHWPSSPWELGFNVEERLMTFYDGEDNAFRAVAFARYVREYGDSLYLPPMEYFDFFAAYQDDFLPFVQEIPPSGERFDHTATGGIHYHLDYRTPYWDPEGGILVDATYEGGWAEVNGERGLNLAFGQVSTVKYLPDLTSYLDPFPTTQHILRPVLEYLGDTRIAVRAYGAIGLPTQGEFFTLGGDTLFRGYDQSQRQGSAVWVGSAEWRMPLAKGLHVDCLDHIIGLRNVYGALFYDIGDAYTLNKSVGPVAHAVGGGLRFDVSWFGFVERTILRLDVAKTVNDDSPTQVWFGVQYPF
jgi:Peptidase family M1 domain